MFGQIQTTYEFGPFRVDTRERQLTKDGAVVPLRPKVFDILLMLVENSGHVLTKDDVMKHVWSDTAVEEGNISRTISALREALGEDPREHRYIETVPWRGYRFVASVRQVLIEERWRTIESVAVLPFVNVSGDPDIDYLAEGITDGLITGLAQLPQLRVTSRNSAFRYKGRQVDAKSVGRELKVQALLVGRLAQAEDLLSVSVEMIDTSDDRHVWGAQYVRSLDDLLVTYETIVAKIREKFGLNKPAKTTTPQNREAYVSYLKGRYYFNKLTPDGVEKAKDYLQSAIETDSTYALAHAALADCYNYLAQRDKAKEAIVRALELDERLGEAHASLGFFQFLYEWNFEAAELSFKRALELNPSYAEAHHWYAIFLANLGRHVEAEREARFAVELDPLSLLMNMTEALNSYLAREYDKALDQLQKVLDMEPNFLAARSVRGNVLAQKGLCEEALNEFGRVLDQVKGLAAVEASVKAIMAQACARSGKRSDALKLLEEVNSPGAASPYSIAGIHAALGYADSAIECLNKAYEARDVQLVSLKVDPSLDGVRGDPRFGRLVSAVGIP
jgi:TolB-like protein/Tfp pilus assembly protein PilF